MCKTAELWTQTAGTTSQKWKTTTAAMKKATILSKAKIVGHVVVHCGCVIHYSSAFVPS